MSNSFSNSTILAEANMKGLSNMSLHILTLTILSILFFPKSEAQEIPYLQSESPWADSVLAQMTVDEKIGQLFNIAAYSNKGQAHQEEVLELINTHHIGGLTFFQGGPHRQAKLTQLYQNKSRIPLMVAIDGEWGMSMRLDSSIKYPWQMTLGAIEDDSLIYAMGVDIAKQLKRIGVNVNFAPVVDINNNPKNPVINARSFGEDKERVARKGIAYMKGMQSERVLATAKHFPGHGDTDSDSHKTLPQIKHSKERIEELELYPFRALMDQGVGALMSAHLYLPAFTGRNEVASSLSKTVIDSLLRQKMNYRGLVFTDGLNMGGVANYQQSAQIDLQALQAGNDILLLSQDVPAGVAAVKAALATGTYTETQLNASVARILKAKEWMGLHQGVEIEVKNLIDDLNAPDYEVLNRRLIASSLTVLKNKSATLPVKKLDQKIAVLSLAPDGVSYEPFQEALNRYTQVDAFHYSDLPVSKQKGLMDELLTYDLVIVGVHLSNRSPWVSYQVDNEFKNFLNILRLKQKVIVDLFANAYALNNFIAASYANGLVVSYQNSKAAQELSAQLIFGAIEAKGRLPISLSPDFEKGMGEVMPAIQRLQYGIPEEVGIRSAELAAIDEVVEEGIEEGAYPGAQVMVARHGKVIYDRNFGVSNYDDSTEVNSSLLYDLASVTKIASTVLALMDLDGKGKLSLDDPLGKHLKWVRKTDYETVSLREMLAHQAGFVAWIPFYQKTLVSGIPNFDIYSRAYSKDFPYQVADDLYISKAYADDSIFHRIVHRAKVKENKEYKYSDIGYYFLKEIVEDQVKQPIEEYNETQFYAPLGMNRTAFRPLQKFAASEIAPTEDDQSFRRQLVHGYVHDPGAAMLGGVGGHAGLFSNANDMMKLMQMFLQEGKYGDRQFLKASTVEEYTQCQFCVDSIPMDDEENRRGAGFDKPAPHGQPGPTCDCISFASYGHSGFTGTYVWVDPDEELVYIFLSNRVYPKANNRKLVELNIRTRIQEKIYDAIHNADWRSSQSALNYQP